jgi:phytanoyl-CoA hydroxylase
VPDYCRFLTARSLRSYPDEWHWREGISLPLAFREIVNGWKSDPLVASVARSEDLGQLVTALMGWKGGARLAQDDVLWKPPLAGPVGWHTDAAYISTQFSPSHDVGATIWIALDDADETTGVVEYAAGSHLWRRRVDLASSAATSSFHGGSHEDYQRAVHDFARAAGISDFSITRLAVGCGSCIIHHQDTWHGSAPNRSNSIHRRALGVHLVDASVRWRSSPPPDYIYGRYVLTGEDFPRDEFFPLVFDKRSSKM